LVAKFVSGRGVQQKELVNVAVASSYVELVQVCPLGDSDFLLFYLEDFVCLLTAERLATLTDTVDLIVLNFVVCTCH